MRGILTNRTVTALYADYASAQQVAEDLVSMGFQPDTISIVANDASGQLAGMLTMQSAPIEEDVSMGEGASFGAVVGALIGLGAMAIPGIGPVIAAGPLVSLLIGAGVGAATGAVTGGLIAGLVEMGVPEAEAGYYAEGVRRGGTLVLVNTTEDWVERVVEVMETYNPINIDRITTEWRSGGWTGFDASGAPIAERQLAEAREAYRLFDDDMPGTRVYRDATG